MLFSIDMAPRKKNLHRRETVKVPYAVLYTHKTAEEKPQAAPPPREREETIREAAEESRAVPSKKPVPRFARKKK